MSLRTSGNKLRCHGFFRSRFDFNGVLVISNWQSNISPCFVPGSLYSFSSFFATDSDSVVARAFRKVPLIPPINALLKRSVELERTESKKIIF